MCRYGAGELRGSWFIWRNCNRDLIYMLTRIEITMLLRQQSWYKRVSIMLYCQSYYTYNTSACNRNIWAVFCSLSSHVIHLCLMYFTADLGRRTYQKWILIVTSISIQQKFWCEIPTKRKFFFSLCFTTSLDAHVQKWNADLIIAFQISSIYWSICLHIARHRVKAVLKSHIA